MTKDEIKEKLDELHIEYDGRWKEEKLFKLLKKTLKEKSTEMEQEVKLEEVIKEELLDNVKVLHKEPTVFDGQKRFIYTLANGIKTII